MCESLIFSYLPHFLPFFKTLVSIYHFNSYKKDCEIFFSLNKALGQGPCSLISISLCVQSAWRFREGKSSSCEINSML